MARYEGILIHFGELWLKGRNRSSFIRTLYNNIIAALKYEDYDKLDYLRDRFFLVFSKNSDFESISRKLSKVFGISRYSPVVTSKTDLGSILEASNKFLDKRDTVRLVPHRSVKNTKYNSSELVSHFIKNEKKLKFGMDKDAEKELFINIADNTAYLYNEKIPGANGLPVGSSGKSVILLSGGIDSPVASYYSMKRGLSPVYMHVHAFPGNDDQRLSKIKDLVKILSEYHSAGRLYLIPGHVFQSSAMKTPKKYELVLFKLFLYRLAEEISKKENADCLVSGESLGQVASQTVGNLTSSETGIKKFIMRPLVGFDKQEIIDMARKIGTYETSIMSYKDVCSIVARNPSTNTSKEKIKRLWKESSMDSALKLSMKKATSS